MTEKTDAAVTAGRRHIISRPRLTRLLDETTARIVLLVAPAGYGKTTLAREWLEGRPHAWYRGTPASADVAALAVGLAEAVATLVPGAGQRMRERVKAAPAPELEADVFAEHLARELRVGSRGAWIVFDDYHFAAESRPADAFVSALATASSPRFCILSRRRPEWCTARRMLYGEIYELDRVALSMTADEASAVLGCRSKSSANDLLSVAAGWPAVIGLAALTAKRPLPEEDLARALYDYFAEELFREASHALQATLEKLALLPSIDPPVVDAFIGADAFDLLDDAFRGGFLTRMTSDTFELHPLLRTFLLGKLRRDPALNVPRLVRDLVVILLDHQRWEEASEVLVEFPQRELILELLRRGTDDLFRDGRLETVARWLNVAEGQQIRSPLVDLIEAELALRHGLVVKSEALAQNAIQSTSAEDELHLDGLLLAGKSAHLSDRYEAAAQYHRAAIRIARSPDSESSALWGLFLACHYLELPEAPDVLATLEGVAHSDAAAALRLANARFHDACRANADLFTAVERMERVLNLASRTSNHDTVASFLQSLAYAFMLTGQYRPSLDVSETALELARRHHLRFAMPGAHCVQAFAAIGLHRFRQASSAIYTAEASARELGDTHSLLNAKTARAKLLLVHGRPADASDLTEERPRRVPTRALTGEYLAMRAMALIAAREVSAALDAADEADAATTSVEARTLTRFVRAIAKSYGGGDDAARLIIDAFRVADSIGHIDGIVTAYRAVPSVITAIANNERHRPQLLRILTASGDRAMLFGMPPSAEGRAVQLSPREEEVYALISRGLTNREIAESLFISEVTVKVHVRHILKKVGARTRVEAVLSRRSTPPR